MADTPSPPEGRRPGAAPPGPARAEYLVALFVAVSWAAVVFAVFGLMAWGLDLEPVPAGVSPYYGLLALAAAGVLVWAGVARVAPVASPWLAALTTAAGVYLVLVASGAVDGLGLIASQAASPFVLVAAGLAAVTVVASWWGIRSWRARHD